MADYLVFEPVLPPVAAALVTAALVAAVIATARRWPLPLSRGRRVLILVLRLGVVAAVALMMFGPVIKWEGQREISGEVAVLLDASRSMAICDVPASRDREVAGTREYPPTHVGGSDLLTRAEAVRQAFLAAGKAYADLGARSLINPYAFGSHVRTIGNFAPVPDDLRTDIGEALDALVAGDAGTGRKFSTVPFPTRLAAVVLISDGRANRARASAERAAKALAGRGIKVHAVLAGSAEPNDLVRDVAVRDLRAPARVFAGNRPEVRVVVAALGVKGKPFDAVLTLNGKEVDRRRIMPAADQTAEELVFTPQAGEPGLARIALQVAPLEGELITTNNRAETAVRVAEGDVRVLYLDGRIRPEGKFIARVLDEAKEIDLDRRLLIGGSTSRGRGVAGAPAPDEVDAFNVVVLGDLPASALDPATVARVAERVREGKLSVLALGGLSAFGAGGWAATPLAGILPFAIRDGDGQAPGPIRFRPTADGAGHFIFKAEKGPGPFSPGGAAAFDALPPLTGASAVGPLQAAARLLAESPDGTPLMAVREFGRGRVAAVTADSTWQWVLAPGDTHGAEVHRRLWRQLVLWLAGRDARPQADLWIATDRPRYLLTDPDSPPAAEVTVHAVGASMPREVRLTMPDGASRLIQLAPADGDWRATVPLSAAGIHRLGVEVAIGNETRRAEAECAVEQRDFETAAVLADSEAMQRIARAGGGTFRRIDGLTALLADLAAGLPPQFEPVERRCPIAGGGIFLAVVVALLAAEWFLRRKWGAA